MILESKSSLLINALSFKALYVFPITHPTDTPIHFQHLVLLLVALNLKAMSISFPLGPCYRNALVLLQLIWIVKHSTLEDKSSHTRRSIDLLL